MVMLKLTVLLLLTGPKVQVLSDGSPEHAKPVTLEPLRLPRVAIVIVVEPLCPGADMLTVVGLAASVKLCTSSVCAGVEVEGRKLASPG